MQTSCTYVMKITLHPIEQCYFRLVRRPSFSDLIEEHGCHGNFAAIVMIRGFVEQGARGGSRYGIHMRYLPRFGPSFFRGNTLLLLSVLIKSRMKIFGTSVS
jgi:hypothetical protein